MYVCVACNFRDYKKVLVEEIEGKVLNSEKRERLKQNLS